MLEHLRQALRLYGTNFATIVAVVATVWVPGNMLLLWAERGFLEPDDFRSWFYLHQAVTLVLGTLADAGVLFVLLTSHLGGSPTYARAMAAGLRNWFPMLITYFVTNLLCGLGLVLIVPGIIFMLRYALVGPVLVAEGVSASRAMDRSKELTNGHKWWLLMVLPVVLIGSVVVGLVPGVGVVLLTELLSLPVGVYVVVATVGETAFDLAYTFMTVFLFVCYCDFAEITAGARDEHVWDEATEELVRAAQEGEFHEDSNPYRAPRFD